MANEPLPTPSQHPQHTLPLPSVRPADVAGEVAELAYRRIRLQRRKGTRVRTIHLKFADGVPVEMVAGDGTVIDSPTIPEPKRRRILACEPWPGIGATWRPERCRARTYERAKRRSRHSWR